jgi:hypothetical protein
MGANGEHNLEAVGVHFDDNAKQFLFTGGGWLAARHSQSNHVSTQNTFCSKCHAPLQATPQSSWKKGIFKNTDPVPNGATEAITCATCHPSHTVAAQLGRRLGVYQWGKDRNTVDAYKVVQQGDEDTLCLNCHQDRHNTDNPRRECGASTAIWRSTERLRQTRINPNVSTTGWSLKICLSRAASRDR